MENGMSEAAGAGRTRHRFFRSSWFSVLLGAIAVALLLVAILVPSKHGNDTAHRSATAPAASVATPSSASSPCGGAPLGVGGRWKCSFDDEFNETSLDTANWQPQLTANSGYVTGGPDCYVDNPDTISVSGGHLNLSALRVAPFPCTARYESSYQVGMVSSSELFSQTYGVFEVRAKIPAATSPGLQETLWLYPQNLTYGPWPASGEIDFAEFFSNDAGYDVPYVHYAKSASDANATAFGCTIDRNAFNTYAVDWTPTSITFLTNGQVCLIDRPIGGPAPFDQPFFISLTQALGVGANAPTSGTPLPATTQIDWVRAWEPAG
jgi:beta-glucanase (GH16 family)